MATLLTSISLNYSFLGSIQPSVSELMKHSKNMLNISSYWIFFLIFIYTAYFLGKNPYRACRVFQKNRDRKFCPFTHIHTVKNPNLVPLHCDYRAHPSEMAIVPA